MPSAPVLVLALMALIPPTARMSILTTDDVQLDVRLAGFTVKSRNLNHPMMIMGSGKQILIHKDGDWKGNPDARDLAEADIILELALVPDLFRRVRVSANLTVSGKGPDRPTIRYSFSCVQQLNERIHHLVTDLDTNKPICSLDLTLRRVAIENTFLPPSHLEMSLKALLGWVLFAPTVHLLELPPKVLLFCGCQGCVKIYFTGDNHLVLPR